MTGTISASLGSSTSIRSRSSGSARAVDHGDGLGGRPGDTWPDLRCDSGAVLRLHQHVVPARRLLTPSCNDPEYLGHLRQWRWIYYP
jgi:hypothetical protein